MLTRPARIPIKIKNLLFKEKAERYVSQVSLLEIGFKVASKKLDFPLDKFMQAVDALQADYITIEINDVEEMIKLPLIHKDPYDRLMVAQAKNNDFQIVTSDPALSKYKISTLQI